MTTSGVFERHAMVDPVHSHVLDVDDPEGRAFVFVCWRDPGGLHSLHRVLARHVESLLLGDLSQPASHIPADRSEPRFLRLLTFEPLPGDVFSAVRAFGMKPANARMPGFRRAIAHARHEAQVVKHSAPDEPTSVWEADVLLPSGPNGVLVRDAETSLRKSTGEERWGDEPGAPTRRLSRVLEQHGHPALAPTMESLHALERLVVQTTPGPVRWIPPLVFQAVCDFLAVVARTVFDAPVAWAASEADEEHNAHTPPLVRIGATHIPLGLHVLRWCIMPLQTGEVVPPLADWVSDQFAHA